ncbi:endonuclease VII [Xanthomonas phage XAJ24]|uniref:DNA exonuclease VII n=1 Tax=Xanthomonas phage XAJ24 TaxID=1775250 RepID=A0A1I9L299_9CAUD|nr:endonuclease VII [Xanthomonas phage XAJ24]AMW36086.1 DNA exonuclease VII [Xanthomonas phage XAJ24]
MKRLTATQVKLVRVKIAAEQGNRCALCGGQFGIKAPLDPVLDHCHTTGSVRGVLHRGCNSLLGKVENNGPRYGVRDMLAFCGGLANYLRKHMTNITGYLHPTHKTEDEKRLLRNSRARKSRALKKKETP